MIEKNYVKSEKIFELPCELVTFFDETNTPNDKVTFGYAVFNPGARSPEEGLSCHERDEYSFIIKGEAKIVIDGKVYSSKANTAGFIPAGEAHYSYNDSMEPCELIWVLVEK